MESSCTTLNTLREAADRLRLSRGTIFKMVRTGQLEVVVIGHRTFVPEDEIERVIETGRVRRGGESP